METRAASLCYKPDVVVANPKLCSGCNEWPPLCDRCKGCQGGFIVPRDVADEVCMLLKAHRGDNLQPIHREEPEIDTELERITITLDGEAILRGFKRNLPDEIDLRRLL